MNQCKECGEELEFDCDFCGKEICESCDLVIQQNDFELYACANHEFTITAKGIKKKVKQ